MEDDILRATLAEFLRDKGEKISRALALKQAFEQMKQTLVTFAIRNETTVVIRSKGQEIACVTYLLELCLIDVPAYEGFLNGRLYRFQIQNAHNFLKRVLKTTSPLSSKLESLQELGFYWPLQKHHRPRRHNRHGRRTPKNH